MLGPWQCGSGPFGLAGLPHTQIKYLKTPLGILGERETRRVFSLARQDSRWLPLPYLVLVNVKAPRRSAGFSFQPLLSFAHTEPLGTIRADRTGSESQAPATSPLWHFLFPCLGELKRSGWRPGVKAVPGSWPREACGHCGTSL